MSFYSYADTDSIKMYDADEIRRQLAKLYMNSLYGKTVTEYIDKEYNMKRNFIIVHQQMNDTSAPVLVFLDSIEAISNNEIYIECFGIMYVTETMEQLSRLLKDKGVI